MKLLIGLLLGLLLGGLLMYFAYPSLQTESDSSLATVKDIDGIKIYILSKPKMEYEPLGKLSEENIMQLANDVSTTLSDKSKNFFEKLSDTFKNMKEHINLRERLESYVEIVKRTNSSAEGLVFDGEDLKEAEMIKFK